MILADILNRIRGHKIVEVNVRAYEVKIAVGSEDESFLKLFDDGGIFAFELDDGTIIEWAEDGWNIILVDSTEQ